MRPDSHPASGLPRPMPRATVPTTALVFSSSHRGFWLSPSMYTVARMNATTNVKKAMPMTANASGRDAEQRPQVADQRAVQVARERQGRVGGRHLADEQAGQRPRRRPAPSRMSADVRLPAAEDGRQHAAGDGAEDDGQERERLEDAVAAGEQVRLEDLGHHPVLGRDEEGRVRAHQEDGRQDDPRRRRAAWPPSVPSQKPSRASAGDADLGDLPDDQRWSACCTGRPGSRRGCRRGPRGRRRGSASARWPCASLRVWVLMAKNMAAAWMAWSLKAARNWATSRPR